ncbi:MAG TPA: (d)CMP kinase [Gemmatimonadota bacterium]|nr:(d)CMP kinase [Gemmatimonadota bacterium]
MTTVGHVVAIDGPSASGKSTTAREVAARLGLVHLNSGLLYRAVTWAALRDGWIDTPEFDGRLAALRLELEPDAPTFRLKIDGEHPGPWLQSAEVTARVSEVSARAAVRERVNQALRAAAEEAGLVVDGRDIGTAVFPDAFLKIFLTASAEERARRRLAERRSNENDEGALTAEAERLRERDRFDASRVIDPLARAEDAVELDSTERGRAEVVDEIVRLYEARASQS